MGTWPEARRSQLDLTHTAMAPHGTFTGTAIRMKAGERLALTQEQRVAGGSRACDLLAEAEIAYDSSDRRTDY